MTIIETQFSIQYTLFSGATDVNSHKEHPDKLKKECKSENVFRTTVLGLHSEKTM